MVRGELCTHIQKRSLEQFPVAWFIYQIYFHFVFCIGSRNLSEILAFGWLIFAEFKFLLFVSIFMGSWEKLDQDFLGRFITFLPRVRPYSKCIITFGTGAIISHFKPRKTKVTEIKRASQGPRANSTAQFLFEPRDFWLLDLFLVPGSDSPPPWNKVLWSFLTSVNKQELGGEEQTGMCSCSGRTAALSPLADASINHQLSLGNSSCYFHFHSANPIAILLLDVCPEINNHKCSERHVQECSQPHCL